MRRISVIGTGYVGLVHGVMMAETGFDVICMDIDIAKIERLRNGECPIYEPGLEEIMMRNIESGRIAFSTCIIEAIENSELIFLAVGTPAADDGSADLSGIFAIAEEIGRYINGYKVVVNKSTVPIGTTRKIKSIINEQIQKRDAKYGFSVVSNPEFLREGKAIRDISNPDRIVIGTEDDQALEIMKSVYQAWYLGSNSLFFTNIETSEMIKYASNTFLAVKISFINEMALLAEKVGADITEVAKAMGMDGRISPKFLRAGPGYGGSCFPKDTKAIVESAKRQGEEMLVIQSAIAANEKQKIKSAMKIVETMSDNGDLAGKKIAIWGLSFKPDTDDVRDAPSITIIKDLAERSASISAFCPKGMEEAKKELMSIADRVTYCENEYEAVNEADAVVLITEWAVFRGVNLEKVKELMRGNMLFDFRFVFKDNAYAKKLFDYYCIGITDRREDS